MEQSDKTARQIWADVKANPNRARFGFGRKGVLVNIDLQRAYTDTAAFATAYETDPRQIEYVNALSPAVPRARLAGRVDACGLHGVRRGRRRVGHPHQHAGLPAEHQVRLGAGEFDPRCEIDEVKDVIYLKRMPSAFFETQLQSLLVWHQVDTVVLTGGSTSGCIRATAVDVAVPGLPHDRPGGVRGRQARELPLRQPTDLMLKYADVVASTRCTAG